MKLYSCIKNSIPIFSLLLFPLTIGLALLNVLMIYKKYKKKIKFNNELNLKVEK